MKINKEFLISKGLVFNNYIRDVDYIVTFLNINYKNSKFLLYGTGLHTKEFIEKNRTTNHISAVIKNEPIDESYTNFIFSDYKIITKNEISTIEYDYILLLGNWSSEAIEQLSDNLNIKMPRLIAPYLDMQVQIGIYNKYLQDNIFEFPKEEKNLVLILSHDRKDVISVASDLLSTQYNMTKLYTQQTSWSECDNEFFSIVRSLNGNSSLIEAYINQSNYPDIVIYWISSQYEMWEAMYVKSILPEECKFIIASSDFYFNHIHNFSVKFLGSAIHMKESLALVNAQCELELIQQCDGIISNFGGRYSNIIKKNYNKEYLFSYYFVNPNSFYFVENMSMHDTIQLCSLGSIEFDVDLKHNPILAYSYYFDIFKELLSNEFQLNVYSSKSLENDTSQKYSQLHIDYATSFHWHNFVPSSKLQKEIAKYDFGLVLFNAKEEVQQAYQVHLNSLYQARILSYLAAGIPIIISREYAILADFVKEHGIGISVSLGEIKDLQEYLKTVDYKALKLAVKEFQKKYINQQLDKEILSFLVNL